MSIAWIRRRIGWFQAAMPSVIDYPPFTPAEIEEIGRRIQAGEDSSKAEVDRLAQLSPVMQGEILMGAHRGNVWMKRYGGVDLADL